MKKNIILTLSIIINIVAIVFIILMYNQIKNDKNTTQKDEEVVDVVDNKVENNNKIDIKKYLIDNKLINKNDKTYVIDLDNDGVDEILVWDSFFIGFGSTPQVWYIDRNGNPIESDVVSDNLLQVLDVRQVLNKEYNEKQCVLISEFADGYCYTNYTIAELNKDRDNIYLKELFQEECDQEAEEKTEIEIDGEMEREHILKYIVNDEVVSKNEFTESIEKYWRDNKIIDEYKIDIE